VSTYHVGWPHTQGIAWVIEQLRQGRLVYWPTDPKEIDQTPYLDYLERDERRRGCSGVDSGEGASSK
jgi:hypothetical protein